MRFYLTLSYGKALHYSPFPDMDKPDTYLYPGLPLSVINQIIHKAQFEGLKCREGEEKKLIDIAVKITGLKDGWQWHNAESISGGLKIDENHPLAGRLCGHQLTEQELIACGKHWGLEREECLRLAHQLVINCQGEWIPAVRYKGLGFECERCGNKEIAEWRGHFGTMGTCPECSVLGKCSSMETLYRDYRPIPAQKDYSNYMPHWELTPAQRLAAKEIKEFYDSQEQRALLWAACGAGKTEVCFPIIDKALEEGKAVLMAAPRQDVIYDIAPRIERDFPQVKVQVLTGMVKEKLQEGSLVLATTHQILRFYQAFDLVILDEMDAFPYEGSEMLHRGIMRGLKQGGKLLYLTATPGQQILKAARRGRMRLIILPARHHRRPLPVPVWKRVKLEPAKPNKAFKEILTSLIPLGTVLVFVPLIQWVDPWVEILRKEYPFYSVAGSYSSDEKRQEKIKNLKEGKYDIFVSTTILERGVTVAGAQVIVIEADHPVFNERSLVQMAGRVGRTKEKSYGKVFFLAKRKTLAIKTAIHRIKELNRKGIEQGLID